MRAPRIIVPEGFFHVTARGNNRQKIFQTHELKLEYIRRLNDIFPTYKIRMLAYCLMTNHVHLLIQDVTGGGLPSAMERLQGGYAQFWNRRMGRTGHVFGERHKPEPVERDDHLVISSCYIHINPRAAGMVLDVMDYRWSSARAFFGGQSDIPVCPEIILDMCGGVGAYAKLLRETPYQEDRDDDRSPKSRPSRNLWMAGPEEFRKKAESLVERRAERRRLARRPKGVDLEQIWREVEFRCGVGRAAVMGQGRTRKVTKARALFCVLARREGISSTEIAAKLERTVSAVIQLAANVDLESPR